MEIRGLNENKRGIPSSISADNGLYDNKLDPYSMKILSLDLVSQASNTLIRTRLPKYVAA